MGFLNIFKRKKPNIIMILIDAGGRYDAIGKVGFYNKLKKDSVFLESIICYAPYTIGCMNSMFSGMTGNKNGVNGYYKSYSFDKKNIFTLTQYLKEQGYRTELDFVIKDVIPEQSFDAARIFEKNEKLDLFERHAEILNRLKGKQPFFVFLDYDKIALELVPNIIKKYDDFSEEYFKKKGSNFERYVGWMERSGEYVKKMIDKTKELGLYDDSIIIILSDHGCSVGDRVGEKVYGVYLYDYTIKCWAYILGNSLPKNVEVKSLVRHIDILPTLLDMLKIREKEGYKKIQGKSFLSYFSGKFDDRAAYSETGGLGGPTPSPEIHNVQSIRTNEWKLIYNKTSKAKELYSLVEDKEEKNNLIGKNPEIEKYLLDKMEFFSRES